MECQLRQGSITSAKKIITYLAVHFALDFGQTSQAHQE